MNISYVGSFLTVQTEGYTFRRHVPQFVPAELAEKLLAAQVAGVNVFAEAA